MNYVSLQCRNDQVSQIIQQPGIIPGSASLEESSGDQKILKFYCSDACITQLQNDGFALNILSSQADRDDHFANLEDDEDGATIV
jgi:hypothetical protein